MSDCPHQRMKFDLSAQTSLMAVTFHVFGVQCEDCDLKWDVGQLLEAVPKLEAMERVIEIEIQEDMIELTPVEWDEFNRRKKDAYAALAAAQKEEK